MKFSNFLFPQSTLPEHDGQVIDETLAEARLCDALGMDALWLAEHHFDGNCAYVAPISFAAALAVATQRIDIGFAVAQMSLHHPIRMAEQLALIDHLSKGRLLVGLGRGTAYNIYEYLGFGIPHTEAHERLHEAEEIMRKAWSTAPCEHRGKYWNIWLPALRPRPYTQPHPRLIHACSGEASMLEMAQQGRPFLMNVQTDAVTRHRLELYRTTMRQAGFDDAAVADAVANTWVWRNIFVADTDAEAERLSVPLFEAQREHRARMRHQVATERGESMVQHVDAGTAPAARNVTTHSLICGSPTTVAERLAVLEDMGVGGLILQFRLGPAPYDVTANSIRLFMDKVAPEFHAQTAV